MTAQLCPQCTGPRIPDHPAGFVWDHTNTCPLRDAEDATACSDHELTSYSRRRPTTTTERALLGACGITPPDDAVTTVQRLTLSVLRRTWDGVDLDPIDVVEPEEPST